MTLTVFIENLMTNINSNRSDLSNCRMRMYYLHSSTDPTHMLVYYNLEACTTLNCSNSSRSRVQNTLEEDHPLVL